MTHLFKKIVSCSPSILTEGKRNNGQRKALKRKEQEMMDIYVSNLRTDVTEDDLKTSLGDIGVVTDVEIHRNPKGSEKQTFAVVSIMPYVKISERTKLIQSVVLPKH
jgi:hypothetical protein